MLTRREFTGGLASVFGAGALGGCLGLRQGEARAYSMAVLGDLHYDTSPETVYHAKFIERFRPTGEHPVRFKEFVRNAKMWAGPSRKILAASGRCVTDDTAMVLQMGDLIQGDCNDLAVHRRMLDETAALMKSAYPASLPFVTTCGNHDIREGRELGGRGAFGAQQPYADCIRAFETRELGPRLCGPIEDTTFAFREGPDLYLIIDFNSAPANIGLTKRLLAENPDVRYTFVLVHGGVFPFDSWDCRWFYLGGANRLLPNVATPDPLGEERREMRRVLARRNAIVLCGHTHCLELKDAEFPEGRITEMTMNTMQGTSDGRENPAVPDVVREGPERYGDTPWVRNTPDVKALFDEYRPFMKRYYFAKAVGHARLCVSDAGVRFDFYGRDAVVPTKTFRLR